MKTLYTTLLTGLVLSFSTEANAQSIATAKTSNLIKGAHLVAPHPGTQNGSDAELRGGAPANDLCSAVTADALAAGATLVYEGTTTGATNVGDAEAGSDLDLGGDTVFVFHAITTTECTDLAIGYCGTATIPEIYQAVLSLTCPMSDQFINFSGGEFTSCEDGNATIYWTAVPAGTYYIPVRGEPATAGPYTLTITATACPVAPANDECEASVVLTPSVECVGTPFNTTGATSSLEPIECAGFTSPNALDVWFSFVATSTDHTIGVVGTNAADAVIELFEGTCSGLASLACADSTFPMTADETTAEELIQTGLTIGNTYFVRVYDWGHASEAHAFEICVTEGQGTNIGIGETTAAEWSIFPNPGTGVFSFQYVGENAAGTIEVFDLTGRVVYTQQAQLNNSAVRTIDLSGVAAGNYNVRLTANGVRTEQRLMVK